MTSLGDFEAYGRDEGEAVRLIYHYNDGHDFTTEPMLRTEALAYMPLLRATQIDSEHFHAAFAEIELRSV